MFQQRIQKYAHENVLNIILELEHFYLDGKTQY